MSWLKVSDDCFQYPKLLEILGYAPEDPRIRLEVFGFVVALASLSASHNTDYKISFGHVLTVAGDRGKYLTSLCEKVGILTKISESPLQWSIIADPDFLHMRLKDEVLWDRQQRKDTNDPTIYGPVRKRDGDNCRWCGVPVVWRGSNRNARKGSLDHLNPGEAGTVETIVVSCLNCNASKKNSAYGPGERELLPVPTIKRYTQGTVDDLAKIGIYVNVTVNENPSVTVKVASQEPSAVSSGGQVDPANWTASECELSSQANQPEEDPYFGVSHSSEPSESELSSQASPSEEDPHKDASDKKHMAGRLSSRASQSEDDPTVNKMREVTPDRGMASITKDLSPGGARRAPADAWTEAVEPATPPGEKSCKKHQRKRFESPNSLPRVYRLVDDSHPIESRLPGSGRVGTGRDSPGQDRTGPDGSPQLFSPNKSPGRKTRRRR